MPAARSHWTNVQRKGRASDFSICSSRMTRAVVERQPERRDAARCPLAVLERERPPVRFRDLARQNQSDSGALGLGREEGNKQIGAADRKSTRLNSSHIPLSRM